MIKLVAKLVINIGFSLNNNSQTKERTQNIVSHNKVIIKLKVRIIMKGTVHIDQKI